MKKTILRTAILLVAGCCIAACSGSDDVTTTPETPSQPAGNGSVELTGKLESKGDMTRSVSADGTSEWEVGEQFAIYYPTASGNSTAIATVSDVNENGSAVFRATLYGPKIGQSNVTIVYPAKAHDGHGGFKSSLFANQEGTLDYVSSNLDIQTATAQLDVTDRSPKDPAATLTANVTMTQQVCIYKFNLKKDASTALEATKFKVSDGTNTYTVTPSAAKSEFCIAMLPAANADFTFEAATTESAKIYQYQCDFVPENITTAHLGCIIATDGKVYNYDTVDGIVYSKSFTGKTLQSGHFYSQDLTLQAGADKPTAVAMIAYVGEDTAEGFYGFNHGLAISMFGPSGTSSSAGTTVYWNTGHLRKNTYQAPTKTGPFEYAESGLQYRRDPARNSDDFPAFKLAAEYSVTGFDPTAYSCSEWFICSAYQWLKMQGANGGMGSNQTLGDAMYKYGGSPLVSRPTGTSATYGAAYWTCTELVETKSGWNPETNTRQALGRQSTGDMDAWVKNSNNRPIRPVFAF